ncbi:hypothetical protein [Kribbella sp. CA-247076]|uniref:hypothetical protein n=1 Tax=Kribbella sp. CA-247076 TaxID=3239941 RepID=UPI003D8C41C7
MPTDTAARAARWNQRSAGVPAWAPVAAHVIALCTIPSALWRIGIIVGFPVGYDEGWIRRSELDTPHGAGYLLFLCVLSEALALLSFGLVHRWGEIVPAWLPGLGGRRIPRAATVVPAGLGALALIAVWTVGVPASALTGSTFDPEMTTGTPFTVQLVAYAPMTLWGPLLAALAWQRWWRSGEG